MNTLFKAIAITLVAVTCSLAQAATVTIFVDGTMSDVTGGDDNYAVDGTSAQFELVYDTTTPDSGSGVVPGAGNYALFDAVSAELTVNGELHVISTSALISANNYHISGTDSIDTASGQALGGSLSGLIMTDFVFELVPAVFPGTGSPANLPSLTNADITTIFAPLFEEDFTFDPQYQFVVQGLSVTTTVVPVPAAAWLFGSALVALGWLRRR